MDKRDINISLDLGQVCNDLLANCNLISKSVVDEALTDIRADIQAPDSDETKSIICRGCTEAFGNLKYMAQRYLTVGRTVDDNRLERLAYLPVANMLVAHVDTTVYPWPRTFNGYGNDDIRIATVDAPTVMLERQDGYDDAIALPLDIPVSISVGNTTYISGGIIIMGASTSETNLGNGYREFRIKRVDGDTENLNIFIPDKYFTPKYEVLHLKLHIPNFNLAVTDRLKSCSHSYMVNYVTNRFLRDLLPEKAQAYQALTVSDADEIRKCLACREKFNMRRTSWF